MRKVLGTVEDNEAEKDDRNGEARDIGKAG
jgi:hypothetical protein